MKNLFQRCEKKNVVYAIIAFNIIIQINKKFKSLMGNVFTTSVRYLKDVIFGINKCKVSENSKKLLNDINQFTNLIKLY